MTHPLLSEVHTPAHPSRCQHWPNGDERCESIATHWLTHEEDGGQRVIGRMCGLHATRIVAEYAEAAEAFGYETLRGWSAVPMVRDDSDPFDGLNDGLRGASADEGLAIARGGAR
jgi:hypothetical protein